MHTDSTAAYYAALYTRPELSRMRATAAAELAALTVGTQAPAGDLDQELTRLLDHIRLYTAALRLSLTPAQLA